MSDSTVPVNATRGCDHLPCPAPARRLPPHIAGRPPSLALVLSDHDGAPLGRWVYPPGAGCWVAEDGGLLSLDEVENEVRTLIRRTPDVG